MARRRRGIGKLTMRPETIHSVVAVILIVLGILVLVSFSGQGEILKWINTFLGRKLGASVLLMPFVFFSAGLVLFRTKWAWSKPHVFLGTLFLYLGFVGTFQTGEIGQQLFTNLTSLVAPAGSYALFIGLMCIGWLVMTQFSIADLADAVDKLTGRPAKKPAAAQLPLEKSSSRFSLPKLSLPHFGGDKHSLKEAAPTALESGPAVEQPKPTIPPLTTGVKSELPPGGLVPAASQVIWEYPPLSLLSASEGGEADRGDVKQNAHVIETTLESFGIKAKVVEVHSGPSVTQYAIDITKGTKLSKITALSTDLALALAAPTGQIRIEAPIAGRSLVGVEVPNRAAKFVTLRHMLSSPVMKKHASKLAVSLGINVSNEPVVVDIAKMPHMLIAGATGSGKSVAINSFICSLLFRASPSEVKLILVDPKRVELTGYNDIPHLLTPVIVDPKKVVSALKWATHEMEERYKKLAEAGVRNIIGYNELAGHVAMSSIVIVIDELADIMLFAPAEVEESITRIAQMARAVGIHLILATQRPSVDVLTGLIKANIPARLAFNVSSMTDSRVILDSPGAEKLLGRGDMLFIPPDQAKPMRVQGTFVDDKEITSLISFIKAQGQAPQYQEEVTSKFKPVLGGGGKTGEVGDDGEERDQLYLDVAKYIMTQDKASSSIIQRRFSVGYNRAARIMDQLYAAGMIGPSDGSKPRPINSTRVMEYIHAMEGSAAPTPES